jgi:hypothetical protein
MTLQTKSTTRSKASEVEGLASHLSRNSSGEGGAPGILDFAGLGWMAIQGYIALLQAERL